MVGRDEAGKPPARKLGRGLSEVSHLFLSSAEKRREAEDTPRDRASDPRLWLPRAVFVSITSGDGVRGKTFLTANLAYGLSAEGRRVAVVNADSDRPDISDIVGSTPDAQPSGASPASDLWNRLPVTEAVTRPPLALPPSEPIKAREPKEPAFLALETAGRGAQVVLVDTSPTGEASRAIWQVATLTIVVAEPGSEKMRSSYLTVKRIHAANPSARIGLVLNCIRGYAEGEDCFRKLAEVCRKFLKINLRNYGYILHSPVVNEAYQKATPLVKAFPDSKATKCVEAILGLVMMDESAIARRRKEVTFEECASKKGRLQALKS